MLAPTAYSLGAKRRDTLSALLSFIYTGIVAQEKKICQLPGGFFLQFVIFGRAGVEEKGDTGGQRRSTGKDREDGQHFLHDDRSFFYRRTVFFF